MIYVTKYLLSMIMKSIWIQKSLSTLNNNNKLKSEGNITFVIEVTEETTGKNKKNLLEEEELSKTKRTSKHTHEGRKMYTKAMKNEEY